MLSQRWGTVAIRCSSGVQVFQPRCTIKQKKRVEDLYATFSPKKTRRKPFQARTNSLGVNANYNQKFPSLWFTKRYHDELRMGIEAKQISQTLSRFWDLYRVGKHPTPYTIELLTEACSKNGKTDEAQPLLKLLDRDFQTITPLTYQHLVCGYLREGKQAQAEELAQNSLQGENALNANTNPVYFGVLLQQAWKSGKTADVDSFLERLTLVNFSQAQIESLLSELSPELLKAKSSVILTNLSKTALGSDDAHDVVIYNLAKHGLVAEVQELIKTLKTKNGDIYDSLILANINAGNLDGALQVLETVRTEKVQVCLESYESLLHESVNLNRSQDVQRLLSDLSRARVGIRNPHALVALTSYFAGQGDVNNTKKFWNYAKQQNGLFDPKVAHKVIEASVNAGLHGDAIELFAQMGELNIVPIKETYDVLIKSCQNNSLAEQEKFYTAERNRVFQ